MRLERPSIITYHAIVQRVVCSPSRSHQHTLNQTPHPRGFSNNARKGGVSHLERPTAKGGGDRRVANLFFLFVLYILTRGRDWFPFPIVVGETALFCLSSDERMDRELLPEVGLAQCRSCSGKGDIGLFSFEPEVAKRFGWMVESCMVGVELGLI